MYKNLGDREKTKEYNDKMKNGDKMEFCSL